ncbi:MAG: type IX secretion system membrane protein PorP/SprF [Bacteroidetes bacterium]|nr:type IX secretion system membrane protein PorP/SprF [Bacteroidota bacterium]
MRKIFTLVVISCLTISGYSQQLHFTSQYLQHNSMYNPAAAGMAKDNMVGLSYRSQWGSFPGNPRTYMLYGDFSLQKMKAGIGAYIYRDETGPTSRTGIQLAYSYHIRTGEKSRLGVGLELRALQFAIDKGKLSDALGSNDPILGGKDKKLGIDAGAGVYWTNDKLSVGAAVSQLIQSKLKLADVPNATEGAKLYRHYNIMASYKIQTGDDIFIIPNAMFRAIEHAPSEFDLGAKLDYQDKIWWALNWRVKQFWSIQAGFKLFQRVRLAYSYDYYETPISYFAGGSGAHEIGLQFGFKKK